MKQSFKYIVIIGTCCIFFYVGMIFGEIRWMTLSGYISVYKNIDYLEKLDAKEENKLRKSLQSELSDNVMETSTFLKYGLLSPVDTSDIKTAHKKVAEYRKNNGFQYNKDDPEFILHQEAEKILNE